MIIVFRFFVTTCTKRHNKRRFIKRIYKNIVPTRNITLFRLWPVFPVLVFIYLFIVFIPIGRIYDILYYWRIWFFKNSIE